MNGPTTSPSPLSKKPRGASSHTSSPSPTRSESTRRSDAACPTGVKPNTPRLCGVKPPRNPDGVGHLSPRSGALLFSWRLAIFLAWLFAKPCQAVSALSCPTGPMIASISAQAGSGESGRPITDRKARLRSPRAGSVRQGQPGGSADRSTGAGASASPSPAAGSRKT